MRQTSGLDAVATFVAVAEAGGFSEAARRLGVSPSAVSQAIRGLEARLGAPLLHRSTRSVGLTEVGAEYLRAAAPALVQLSQAADVASGRVGRPAGPLRLTMPRAPFDLVVAPRLVAFQNAYPAIELEIAVEARMIDIVKAGFDAGLRYGNYLDKDMIATAISPSTEAVLAASPAYLALREPLHSPDDLAKHRALVCRSESTGLIIPWNLTSVGGETVQVVPPQATIVRDLASQIDLGVRGLGVFSAPRERLSALLQTGALRHVMAEWSMPLEALYIYFPSHRHRSTALRAFVDFLKRDP